MEQENLFKWRHYQPEIIVLWVRWSLRYSLRYRDLAEIIVERGRSVAHTTIDRWVHRQAPELKKRVRAQLKPTHASWRVDETYSKVRCAWMYRYRAVDSTGNTLEFMLSPHRHAGAAECFFRKALGQAHTVLPRGVNVDKNAAYPPAVEALQAEGMLDPECKLPPVKYLNNSRWIMTYLRGGGNIVIRRPGHLHQPEDTIDKRYLNPAQSAHPASD